MPSFETRETHSASDPSIAFSLLYYWQTTILRPAEVLVGGCFWGSTALGEQLGCHCRRRSSLLAAGLLQLKCWCRLFCCACHHIICHRCSMHALSMMSRPQLIAHLRLTAPAHLTHEARLNSPPPIFHRPLFTFPIASRVERAREIRHCFIRFLLTLIFSQNSLSPRLWGFRHLFFDYLWYVRTKYEEDSQLCRMHYLSTSEFLFLPLIIHCDSFTNLSPKHHHHALVQ